MVSLVYVGKKNGSPIRVPMEGKGYINKREYRTYGFLRPFRTDPKPAKGRNVGFCKDVLRVR